MYSEDKKLYLLEINTSPGMSYIKNNKKIKTKLFFKLYEAIYDLVILPCLHDVATPTKYKGFTLLYNNYETDD